MRVLLIFALLLTMGGSAIAESGTVRVPANKATAIYAFTPYNRSTCYNAGRPTARVTRAPENGEVLFDWRRYELGEGAGRCAGKMASGLFVIYRPAPGFRGTDRFSVSLRYPAYEGSNYQRSNRSNIKVIVE